MELPQARPFGTEGRKPTHDFLSLYPSPVEQDPRPPQGTGSCLKTHDFLEPLERGEKNSPKEDINTVEIVSTAEKPPGLPSTAVSNSVEHILPGGIGTYSISHVSYFNPRIPKSEGAVFTVAQGSSTDRNEETSNCSSYTGSGGFTLWEESAVKKGKTGKENVSERTSASLVQDPKMGQWTSERPSKSSSTHRNSFCSLSTSQPLRQKSQSFIDIIKSAKGMHEEDEEDDEELAVKKESSSHRGDLTVKVEARCADQKANTPRSKHSATEQRRRSKINDRFQMLRELIPHSDQKRDKASFLLEVIEYIQFLQEKVQKYEGSYQGWNKEPQKVLPLGNDHKPTENLIDQTRGINDRSGPALMFASKIDESKVSVTPTIPQNAQNHVDSCVGTTIAFRGVDPQPGFSLKGVPLPMSLQPNLFRPVCSGGVAAQVPSGPVSDAEKASQAQPQLWQNRSCTTDCTVVDDKLKEQEMMIKGGRISISSVYSQGLLNTLTQALHSSGVDLSQASISVQIELGKRPNGRLAVPSSAIKDNEVPFTEQATARSRVSSCCEDSNQSQKRLKISKS